MAGYLSRLLALLFCSLLLGGHAIAASEDTALEEVVVVGKRPGPPLWQVIAPPAGEGATRSVLWVFATLKPLPVSLEWDDEPIGWLLKEAGVYLAPPEASASTSNPLKALGVLRRFNKLKRLPAGQRLADVLPATLAQRLNEATARYAPKRRDLSKLRPRYAAEALLEEAYDRSGLTADLELERRLRKLVRRAKVPVVEHVASVDLATALAIVEQVTPAASQACLATTLSTIERDLAAARNRALAWADGDASSLRAMDFPDLSASCVQNVYNSPAAQAARAKSRAAWLASARRALAEHPLSLASLPARELFAEEGLLAELKAAGYEVRGQ